MTDVKEVAGPVVVVELDASEGRTIVRGRAMAKCKGGAALKHHPVRVMMMHTTCFSCNCCALLRNGLLDNSYLISNKLRALDVGLFDKNIALKSLYVGKRGRGRAWSLQRRTRVERGACETSVAR